MSILEKTAVLLAMGTILSGVPAAYSADAPAKGDAPSHVVKVNFVRPSGWGGRPKFVSGNRQKYLQLVGDPEQKNNQFYYAFYYMPPVKGGEEITFKVSCKLEKLTAGKFQIGIYEFSDPQATKSIRFQSMDVPVSAGWQTLSQTVTLHPKTQCARFYFLGRSAGKGDTLLVRSLELIEHSK